MPRVPDSGCVSYFLSQDKSTGSLWLVGLGLGMLACIFNAFGMVYQRKAHEDDNKCLTFIGIGAVFLAGLLDFASFGFAAQTVIAPVSLLLECPLHAPCVPPVHSDLSMLWVLTRLRFLVAWVSDSRRECPCGTVASRREAQHIGLAGHSGSGRRMRMHCSQCVSQLCGARR